MAIRNPRGNPESLPKGRPKGVKNKATQIREDYYWVYGQTGKQGLKEFVEGNKVNKGLFLFKVIPGLLPKETDVKGDLNVQHDHRIDPGTALQGIIERLVGSAFGPPTNGDSRGIREE